MIYPRTVTECHQVLRQLTQELEEVKALQTQALRDTQCLLGEAMQAYGLTRSEALVFTALRQGAGRVVSRGSILSAIEFVLPDSRPDGSLGVQVHALRRKISPYGFRIETFQGSGYSMSGGHTPVNFIPVKQAARGSWHQKLRVYLLDHVGDFTTSELAEYLQCSYATAYEALRQAQIREEVCRVFSAVKGRSVKWYKYHT